MKKILLLLLISYSSFAQKAIYDKITSQDNFLEYVSKSGKIIKVNDTIQIAYPRAANSYTFILQGNQPCSTILTNTKNVITGIKTIGNKQRGYKTWILFKGYGILPIYVDYEAALETGEIISNN